MSTPELRRKRAARALMRKRGVTYAEALRAVERSETTTPERSTGDATDRQEDGVRR